MGHSRRYTKHEGTEVNTPDSYSGGTVYKWGHGDRPFRLNTSFIHTRPLAYSLFVSAHIRDNGFF